ncbi:MAG: hypothetical protein J6A56_03490 [Clostridia bacterium]|nr:hypothetical protein [Clostridia bacterium]
MQTQTITSPAELQPPKQRHATKAERHAAEHLREDYHKLLLDAGQIRANLQTAQNNFNYLSGAKEIDACIYQIRTDQCHLASTLVKLQELQDRMQNLLEQ